MNSYKDLVKKIFIITAIVFVALIVFKYFCFDKLIYENRIKQVVQNEIKGQFLIASDSTVILNNNIYKLTPSASKIFEKYLTELVTKNILKTDSNILLGKKKSNLILTLPTIKDTTGKYIFTAQDVDNIQEYIKFLTDKVDKAISATNEEFNKSINNLNLWMTIWMGILALIGIFIPIIININFSNEIREAKAKAKRAKAKSDIALNASKESLEQSQITIANYDDIKDSVSSQASIIKGWEDKTKNIEQTIQKITQENIESKKITEEAIESSKTALNKAIIIEQNVVLLNALGDIKDFSRISLLPNNNRKKYLANKIAAIHEKIKPYEIDRVLPSQNQLFKSILIDIRTSIFQVNGYISPSRNLLDKFTDTVTLFDTLIQAGDANIELVYSNLGDKLQELITVLNEN